MLVFIDESGCSGFRFPQGSDPVFALAMVIFAGNQDAARTEFVVRLLHSKLGHRPEFKFSKCRDSVRDGFFAAVSGQPFSIRAIVVNKGTLGSARLCDDDDAFYAFFIRQLLKFGDDLLSNAKIRIDGSGNREFRRDLSRYVRGGLRGKVGDLRMTDSARDPLIQLADMCVGAIARAYRDRPQADRWLKMLQPRIDDIRVYN
jgi:Protein of unknown function (DUF3800)